MDPTITLIDLLGAAALLLWGLRLVKTGVSRAFGHRLRVWIGRGTANRFSALAVGLLATLALQSSTATAMIVSSFAAQSLVSLAMAQAVMLGANIGTSIVAKLLAFDVHWLSSALILAGVAGFKLSRHSQGKGLARALVGLGLMLLSLALLSAATEPLRTSETVRLMLAALTDAPVIAALVAAGLAAACSSSLAVILLAASLAEALALQPILILALVAGANLGGAVPPLLATAHLGAAARRVTVGNLIARSLGTVIVVIFAEPLNAMLAPFATSAEHFVVNAHIAFNLILAAAFLPLLSPLGKVVERIIRPSAGEEFGPRYLDSSALDTPVVALSAAARETLRVGDIVREMLESNLKALRAGDLTSEAALHEMDDQVDRLQEAVKIYLSRLSQGELDESEARRSAEIISYAINLEHIGDIIEKGLADLAARRIRNGLNFSPEGLSEIVELYDRTLENLQLAQTIFLSRDVKLARRLVEVKVEIRNLERRSSERHLERVRQGRRESVQTSSLHLDLLRDLKRINAHITSVAYPVLDDLGLLRESRLRSDARDPAS